MSDVPASSANYLRDTPAKLRQSSRKRHANREDQSTTHTSDTEGTTSYISGLDTYDRIEMVMRHLNQKHRWSMKDLIHHYITAESKKPYAISTNIRIKRLTDTL